MHSLSLFFPHFREENNIIFYLCFKYLGCTAASSWRGVWNRAGKLLKESRKKVFFFSGRATKGGGCQTTKKKLLF